jgi:protein-disulfide isomerase
MEDEKLTKKEKRALAKEEKKKEKKRQELSVNLQKYALILVVVLFLGWLGIKVYNFINTPTPEVANQPVEIVESDHVKGNEDAKVILIEYGDYQCPACGTYYSIVKQLEDNFSNDQLAVVFRNFPLVQLHKNAMTAAKAAEAAAMQGKFWEMHDMLYENQENWSDEGDTEDIFIGYAEELGLDKDKFLSDFNSDTVQQKIDADIFSANRVGVNATPTFILNGVKLSNPGGFENMKNRIESTLNSN